MMRIACGFCKTKGAELGRYEFKSVLKAYIAEISHVRNPQNA